MQRRFASRSLRPASSSRARAGWYVTDFRGGNNGGAAKPEGQSEPSGDAKSDAGGETKTSGASETKTEPKPAAEPAAKKAAATTTTSSSGTGSDS